MGGGASKVDPIVGKKKERPDKEQIDKEKQKQKLREEKAKQETLAAAAVKDKKTVPKTQKGKKAPNADKEKADTGGKGKQSKPEEKGKEGQDGKDGKNGKDSKNGGENKADIGKKGRQEGQSMERKESNEGKAEQAERGEQGEKGKKPKKKKTEASGVDAEAVANARRKSKESSTDEDLRDGDPLNPHCKVGFGKLVSDTMRANSDFITVKQMEAIIVANYNTQLDTGSRKKMMRKVVGEEFLRGCIEIKPSKC